MAVARVAARLLEREHELAVLHRAWREARAGHGSTWVLCAEAGGGKTRLVTEFLRTAAGQALLGAAEPLAPPEPFLAVSRALPGFVPAPARGESVARVLAVLEQVTAGGPAIVFLDDLHFADDGTVAVLLRLAAECSRRPWLVLAACRPGEGPATLQPVLTETVAQGRAFRLDLPPLSRNAVAALIRDVRGAKGTAADAETIYADSGGNPWFAEALARGNGAVAAARDHINLRLDRLDAATPGALPVVRALAPTTRPLPYAVTAALCGGDEPALRQLLGRLRDVGVLRETEDGAWGFRHELLRRSVLEMMITADRHDAHRALAQTLERLETAIWRGEAGDSAAEPAPTRRRTSAAELAMHYAAAGDARAAAWALRAAEEARAVDAHVEAMAQIERALRFELEPELRRSALQLAALEAYNLARFAESLAYAEAALGIPGSEPEARARLHWIAARAAQTIEDLDADEHHLTTAERILAERPPSHQALSIALARVERAGFTVRPDEFDAAADRARQIAYALGEPAVVRSETLIRGVRVLLLLQRGDPAGFAALDDLAAFTIAHRRRPWHLLAAQVNAYGSAVFSLFHGEADPLYSRIKDGLQALQLGWSSVVEPYRVLELVQRGRYEEARALSGTIDRPLTDSVEDWVLSYATLTREVRAGSLNRARAMLDELGPSASRKKEVLRQLARLELAMAEQSTGLGELARQVYTEMEACRYARIAGVSAVALAAAERVAPPTPEWLAPESPLRVFWEWSQALARGDPMTLRLVSARLCALTCPYEAAIALRDAGDLGEAYRMLRQLSAVTARERLGERLRAAGQRVPRRSRAAVEQDGLTDAERALCRLVAAGARNHEIAVELDLSLRTVEAYLGRLYAKTGLRGKAALAVWWAQRDDA